ncbi:MAG: prepilin peptidase [Solirubrobacteraceae bacterium]
MTLALPAAALLGLVVGSLLSVLAHRLPRGESLVTARSHCPHCRQPVRPRDIIPVVSWLRLRGRCRDCGEPIARRYALVEAGTAALFVAVVIARRGDAAELVLGLVLVAVLVPLALIDLDTRLLPNRIMLPAAVAALVLGTLLDASGEVERLLAALVAGAFFLLAALAFPRGMGIGDVKLAAVLGLFLGRDVAAALLVALVVGVLVGAVIIARKGVTEGRRTAVAFGPFLALGGVVALLVGDDLVDAYVGTF